MYHYSKDNIQRDTDYRQALNDAWTTTQEMLDIGMPVEHIARVMHIEYKRLWNIYKNERNR